MARKRTSTTRSALLNTGREVWEYLQQEGGLDPAGYDNALVETLLARFGRPGDSWTRLPKRLEEAHVGSEEFLQAFLRAVEPYAGMMVDLCAFFEKHGVRRTNHGMRVLFDFGKGPKDLCFDLEHFRENLRQFRSVQSQVEVLSLSQSLLWDLCRLLGEVGLDAVLEEDVHEWLGAYDSGQLRAPPSPPTPPLEDPVLDGLLRQIWRLWMDVILQMRRYGEHRDFLRRALWDSETSQGPPSPVFQGDMERRRQLAVLDSDHWPARMLHALANAHAALRRTDSQEREKARANLVAKVTGLLAQVHRQTVTLDQLVEEVVSILALPFWTRRHELYATWVLAAIDEALDDYPRHIHHVEGDLVLRFSGTHVARLDTQEGPVHLFAELKSPLAAPVGRGRKRHIQPDYTLTLEPVTDVGRTRVVVECKQYKRANLKSFGHALTDYAHGRPEAHVLLASYSDAPSDILAHVAPDTQIRCLTIGRLQPGSLESLRRFRDALRRSLPPPAFHHPTLPIASGGVGTIYVDVSGSMQRHLAGAIHALLQLLAGASSRPRLVAIDSAVAGEWTDAATGLAELASVAGGDTRLPTALRGRVLTDALLVTDAEGWGQLKRAGLMPRIVLEVGTSRSLTIHTSLSQ